MAENFLMRVPSLLVSMPQLEDPNFHQTVVLVLNHDAAGSFGLVINRPAELVMGALEIKGGTLPPAVASLPVWRGGPVEEERILFLAKGPSQPPSSVRVSEDIYLGSPLEFVAERMEANEKEWEFRVYSGYAGWGPGQLAQEVAASSWLIAPFDPGLVFAASVDGVWSQAVRSIGLDPSQLATETSRTLQ